MLWRAKFLLGRFQDEQKFERMFSFEQTKFWICQLEKLQGEYWGGNCAVYFMVGVTGFESCARLDQFQNQTINHTVCAQGPENTPHKHRNS